jgi:ribosome biogenesis GTPase
MVSIAENKGCEPVVCFNKWDLSQPEELYSIYENAGISVLRVSAETGRALIGLRRLYPARYLPSQEIPGWGNQAY